MLDVALTVDNKRLDEVMVTALGISREKRALGFAVAEVKAAQVVQNSEPDFLRTLTDKVPGVNIISSSGVPGSSSRITIRGNTSLIGSNEPLFIVDGAPYDNSQTDSENSLVHGASYSSRTADVNPNNITTINVLKGAAAALYGSRAAGGVIVITTKTGGAAGAAGTTVAGKPVVTGRGGVAQRLHTYFSWKHTEAELQLTVLNNNAAATTAFREAFVASFDKAGAIASANFSLRMDPARVIKYNEAALAAFNKAGASADVKLEVLMYEKYVASFGYGIDMYTDFRRTDHPRIKVPGNAGPNRGIIDDNDSITQSNGAFPRRLYYSRNDLLVNPNGPKNQFDPVTDRIFWDR